MGELALRYPPRGLTISTGTWPGCEASDARFPQTIDRVAVGAKRLRTVNGLCLWTWRATSLVRRTQPGFAWCDEVKPAGYPAAWLHARGGPPFGVIAHGADFLLLDAKVRRSAFKRWTARRMLERCSVIVANSRWTADLARSVLEFLGCHALSAEVRVVPLGTTPSRFRPDIDPVAVRRKHGLDGGLLASRRYDLLVEGFGISILEASASGLPVIGTRSGGIPEAVREGETGFLVEPDDPAAVAAAAIRLLGDEALRRRIGAAGRAAVETYYNWDRVAADLIRIDREFRKS